MMTLVHRPSIAVRPSGLDDRVLQGEAPGPHRNRASRDLQRLTDEALHPVVVVDVDDDGAQRVLANRMLKSPHSRYHCPLARSR